MLRISKMADYAVIIMNTLSAHADTIISAVDIAKDSHLTLPTVSKLLKILVKKNLVRSKRGPKGGYVLKYAPDEITLATIISAMDGPIAMTQCSADTQTCTQEAVCSVRTQWSVVNAVVNAALSSLSLKDMSESLATHPLAINGISFRPVVSLARES